MKVKLTPNYVIVIINGTDFYFDRREVDENDFLNYDGWGIDVEGKTHLLVQNDDEEEMEVA